MQLLAIIHSDKQAMGLFVFLLIMLAAAWYIVLEIGDGPSAGPPRPVVQHVSAQPKNTEPAVAPPSTGEIKSNDSIDKKNNEQSDPSSSATDNNQAPIKE